MKPSQLRKRAIQLTVIYVIAVLVAYFFVDSWRELIRTHWIWFTVLPVLLIVVGLLTYTRWLERTLLAVTPELLRKWVLYLAAAYVIVVLVLYVFRLDFREYFHQHWLRTIIPLIVLLIIAALARPRALEKLLKIMAPDRLRIWLLQLSALYVIVLALVYWLHWPSRRFIWDHWIWFLVALGILLLVAFLARPRGLELYTEYPEPDEQETIDKIIALLIGQLKKQYDGRLVLRDTHPKSNGLLFGKFEVLADLPDQYRVGLFKTPKTYNCWMRFSNSEPEVTPDHQPDFRGIALKLFEVPGDKLLNDDEQGTVDFLFIAHDAFFAATPKDFFSFFFHLFHIGPIFEPILGRAHSRRLAQLLYFFPKRLRLLRNSKVGRRSYGHPFEIVWFSCAPFKFGDKVVKYKLHSEWPESEPNRGDADYLRHRLIKTLKTQGHTMDFMVQFQEDPNRDLIETTAIPWRVPHFRTIARLHIPQQDFNSPDHLQFDENMTFNLWHCPPDHRPVGGINRARRDVMRAIQEFRLAENMRERTDVHNDRPDDAPKPKKKA